MGRPELGTKRGCAECNEQFYDLNASPVICPKCGATQPAEKPRLLRSTRSGALGARYSPLPPVAVVADDDTDVSGTSEAEDDEDADDVEPDDDTDDTAADIEIDPDIGKAVD